MEEKKDNMTEGRVYTQQEVEAIVAQVNAQARAQCENIARRCQYLEDQLTVNRLDYLFKIVENAGIQGIFSTGFIQKCSDEIESILFGPDPKTQEESIKDTPKEE